MFYNNTMTKEKPRKNHGKTWLIDACDEYANNKGFWAVGILKYVYNKKYSTHV
jgi:hypothetical protein